MPKRFRGVAIGSLIADALVGRGHEVRHILFAQRADPHVLNAGAVIGANGSITYPGTGETQPSLFASPD
ncbi:MAG: hypothetical protein WEE89_00580 [Gemmatimonadota bacterium]